MRQAATRRRPTPPVKSWNERTMRRPAARAHQRLGGAVFDVDELGAEIPGAFEDGDPGLLGAVEPPALPGRAAGGDDRQPPAPASAPAASASTHAVEAQLDQVGAVDGVAALEELGHRRGRHGRAEQGSWHRVRRNEKRLFNREVEEAWSRSSWLVVRGYTRPGASSAKDQYQYQRDAHRSPPGRSQRGCTETRGTTADRILVSADGTRRRRGSVNGRGRARLDSPWRTPYNGRTVSRRLSPLPSRGASCLAALILGGPVGARSTVMPVSEVRPGMVGVGRTVFRGEAVEEFTVRIIGTLKSVLAPQRDLILAKLEGGPLAETGVIAGMSGSPVYIDGRLLGAVSYQLGQFPKEAIAGITPIAEMTDATALAGTVRASRPVPLALDRASTPDELLGIWRRELGQPRPFAASAAEVLVNASAGEFPRHFATDLRPIAVPLVSSGFVPGVLDGLAPSLQSAGFVAAAGARPGRRPRRRPRRHAGAR